ncbi:hypothetical protein BML2537_27630 [Providencia stuartii]|nr:hypothetical protein BML2537_27630 [Providencia stuartii]
MTSLTSLYICSALNGTNAERLICGISIPIPKNCPYNTTIDWLNKKQNGLSTIIAQSAHF